MASKNSGEIYSVKYDTIFNKKLAVKLDTL